MEEIAECFGDRRSDPVGADLERTKVDNEDSYGLQLDGLTTRTWSVFAEDRLSLARDRFVVTAEVRAVAGGIAAAGDIAADVVQSCAATDLPVPAKIREPFDLRFLRDADPAGDGDEEVEISDAEIRSVLNDKTAEARRQFMDSQN